MRHFHKASPQRYPEYNNNNKSTHTFNEEDIFSNKFEQNKNVHYTSIDGHCCFNTSTHPGP